MEDIIFNFNSDQEENNEPLDPLGIKKEDFENLKIIGLFQSSYILKNNLTCLYAQK